MMRCPTGSRAASKRRSAGCDIVDRERRHQRRRIVRRLGHAGRDMRPRHERGIADDRDAAERHARRFEIVDRLQDRFVDQPHDRAELRRQQPLGGGAHVRRSPRAGSAAAGSRSRAVDAALVGEQLLQLGRLVGRPVPDHVVAAMARAADRCPDRRPDSPGTARRAAGRRSCNRTVRDGSPAGTPPPE